MALRPDDSLIDESFLFFALKEQFKKISGLATGATIPGLSIDQVSSIPIRSTSLALQRRIAQRLQNQTAAIEEAQLRVFAQEAAAKSLLDKLLSETFLGITPLSVGRDEPTPPPGWRWRTLSDLARLESGHTPSRRFPEYWADGDIPWLALPDIRALDCRVATETGERTNALGIANSSARVLPAETVALSRTASVGFVTRFGCEMATSQDFVNWVCGPDLHSPYLMWLLRASRAFLRGLATGAVHQTVYTNVVKDFRICLPDLPVQRSIAARLDETFDLVTRLRAAHEAQLAALDALPGAFLREAFGSLDHK